MARWKLMTSHYLNVPNVEWEYSEISRSGDTVRQRFPVPKFLDINDPKCWTNRWGPQSTQTSVGIPDGEIVVCHEGKGQLGDQTFIGDPTPDMMPLDDEAKAISAKFEEKWKYKPETASGEFSQSLIDKFQIQMQEAQEAARASQSNGIGQLVEAMGKMMEQNAAILGALANKSVPESTQRRS